MKRKYILLATLFNFVLSSIALSQEARFFGLGYLPGSFPEGQATGVSGDGSVIVGDCHSQGFYWTIDEGIVGIGQCKPSAASYDGDIIVGTTRDWESFFWTADSGLIRIGDLPGGDFYSIASDISYDGSVIIGQGKSSNGFEAFRWTTKRGMQGLGDLPGGTFDSRGFAVSPDGSIVVGQSRSGNGREAFVWTESGGMVGLGTLPGSWESSAYGVSEDGSVIVGRCYSGKSEAFRWTAATGMVGLGAPAGESVYSWAKDVSPDGSVIVGCNSTKSGWEAFIWDESDGMRNLKKVLEEEYGLDLTGWTLTWANEVSADGTVIVGRGYNPAGQREGWVVMLPKPLIEVAIALYPKTLRLKSRGKWILCTIWFPEGCKVTKVDPSTIMLEDEIEAAWVQIQESKQMVLAKFSRFEVQQMLVERGLTGWVELCVRGELMDQTRFEGQDTIRVIGRNFRLFHNR